MTLFRAVFALGLFVASSDAASASYLVTWDLTGPGSDATKPGSATNAALIPTALSEGSGVGTSGATIGNFSTNLINSNAWNNGATFASAVTANDFYQMSITAAPGTSFNVGVLTFYDIRAANGPQNAEIAASVNGGNNPTGIAAFSWSPTTTATGTLRTFDFSTQSGFTNLTQFSLRIYGWNSATVATDPTRQYALVNPFGDSSGQPTIQLDVNGVPAPATALLLLTGLPALVLARRKRKATA
jgi:hypothetical protein